MDLQTSFKGCLCFTKSHLRSIVQIPGAGHAIRYDQFEAYFAALSAFLATV